jgi:hypothetical protein
LLHTHAGYRSALRDRAVSFLGGEIGEIFIGSLLLFSNLIDCCLLLLFALVEDGPQLLRYLRLHGTQGNTGGRTQPFFQTRYGS